MHLTFNPVGIWWFHYFTDLFLLVFKMISLKEYVTRRDETSLLRDLRDLAVGRKRRIRAGRGCGVVLQAQGPLLPGLQQQAGQNGGPAHRRTGWPGERTNTESKPETLFTELCTSSAVASAVLSVRLSGARPPLGWTGTRGSGCKCQPLNSGTPIVNLNATRRGAST